MNKIFKNLDEQIEILKSRGLTIEDEEKAKNVLLRENYFFINGYRHMFIDSSKGMLFSLRTSLKTSSLSSDCQKDFLPAIKCRSLIPC